jgi:hypothetical protein
LAEEIARPVQAETATAHPAHLEEPVQAAQQAALEEIRVPRVLLAPTPIAVEEVVQETRKVQAVATPVLQERAVAVVKALPRTMAATAAMEK